jgi:hypothetical protein
MNDKDDHRWVHYEQFWNLRALGGTVGRKQFMRLCKDLDALPTVLLFNSDEILQKADDIEAEVLQAGDPFRIFAFLAEAEQQAKDIRKKPSMSSLLISSLASHVLQLSSICKKKTVTAVEQEYARKFLLTTSEFDAVRFHQRESESHGWPQHEKTWGPLGREQFERLCADLNALPTVEFFDADDIQDQANEMQAKASVAAVDPIFFSSFLADAEEQANTVCKSWRMALLTMALQNGIHICVHVLPVFTGVVESFNVIGGILPWSNH